MQWSLDALVSREWRVAVLRVGERLTPTDWVRIEVIRMGYLARFPHTRTYMAMVTALCERWHRETVTFHLPTREMIVMLEDVYHIFRLLIRGTPIMETREMIVEAVIQRLMGLGVEYKI